MLKCKKLKSNFILDVTLSSEHLMKSKQHIVWLEVNDSESKASGHMPHATGTGHLLCTNKSYLKKVEQEVLRFCLNAALQIHKIHTLYNKIKIFLELVSDLIVDLLVT
jgi:hypothetical protein